MDVNGVPVRGSKAHSAENGCFGAESLPVEEIAPAPDDLADDHTGYNKIEHRGYPHLFVTAQKEYNDNSGYDPSVDGKPAFPYGDYLRRIQDIVSLEFPYWKHFVSAHETLCFSVRNNLFPLSM